jgi:hypothetical protein
MKIMVFFLCLLLSSSLFAQRQDPACNEFKYIKNTMRAINSQSVDRVIPHADWLDQQYRREDRNQAGRETAKVVILALLGRLSFMTFWMMPTRAEAATVTGSFVRNPEGYSRFLQLAPEHACLFLGFIGSDADLLRTITHEVYLELRRARR